jgi:hypothetical protein
MRKTLARVLARLPFRGLRPFRRPRTPTPVAPAVIRDAGPWSRPWPTPVPPHVIERHTPLRGEDLDLVRPYVLPHPPYMPVLPGRTRAPARFADPVAVAAAARRPVPLPGAGPGPAEPVPVPLPWASGRTLHYLPRGYAAPGPLPPPPIQEAASW